MPLPDPITPDFPKIDNHADRMAGLLIHQFRGAPRMNALVRALATTQQDAEDAVYHMASHRWLPSAYGAQLDALGDILGELRFGRSDDIYRMWLYFRIFINASKGTPEDIIEILRFITNEGEPGGRVIYWENHPASVQLFTDGPFVPGAIIDTDLFGPLTLDNGDYLTLDNGDYLIVYPGLPEIINTLLDMMRSVLPAAVGILPISFSLGNYPFGFVGDFVPATLTLDNGDYLELDDGNVLQVSGGDVGEWEWGGFADIGSYRLTLDNGDYLELDTGDILTVVDGEEPVIETDGAGGFIDVIQG